MDKKLVKVGALWENKSCDGDIYFSVDVEGQKYLAFKNIYKETDKQPEYLLYIKEQKMIKEKMWEVGIAGNSELFMGGYPELLEELRVRKIQAEFIRLVREK